MTKPASDGSGDKPELIDPNKFPSWIVEEDEGILAINKPGLIVCHPSKQGPWSSLIGASREYLQQELVHLVHRLDRETSGICLLAKDKLRARHSQMAFQNLQVTKEYLALLEGELEEPIDVNNHLAKDLESEVYIKQAVRKSRTSKRAETRFEPLLVRNGHTLVRVVPKTGRKHQIRIHAQHLGYPIVGDKIYGPDDRLYLEFIEQGYTSGMAGILGFYRQALHAHRVHFDAPEFKRSFTAPLVEDMAVEIKKRMNCSDEELAQLIG
ncbi:RluA family pseudouridine synthase [Opitutia bacterium ISCC 51]|nr:RluA family pseudouridine synthase [Opitutae bacterium ISCC 51]QXD29456.1 RluA family pseudouridine synthase [Opitutae bacterium ISCC 52]